MKSIHDVLAELRESAFDERHKGDLFEALTKKYLEIDPFYGSYFDKVWLYGDWAKETGISKQDIGIDLVARISESGEIVAIQCKFYAEGAYLDKKEIDSFFTASGKEPFRERYIFSTTDNWSKHASDAVEGQQIPTNIIRVQDLDDSGIDWSGFSLEDPTKLGLLKKKTPFPHQVEAIEAAKSHFQNHDRGKMIMACGTGKTYTSLQIVQEMTPKGGTVLFLVPSLALLSQTLKEWKREAKTEFRAYAVCSDSKLSRQSSSEDTRVADLAYPSTTNVEKLAAHFNKGTESELTVIFSTYQSIDVVAQAQSKGLPEFDLIVCDEAHRTTGVTLVDEDESAFVRVHDNNFIKGSKRLYMTATPRIFAEASKAKAEEASAVIASMDDETKFGEEFHRLNFGNAVSRGLLSDYKVLVLTVSETQVSKSLQKILTDGDELKLQDAIKIVGCYNGLRKRGANEEDFLVDKSPMRKAVAFSRSIKDSKRIAELFSTVTSALNEEANEKNALIAEADHVDGTFNVLARNEKLDWLKDKKTENTVRVLSNARCLSEGVDVPALDAVLFLNPRDSQVDVVQSVGRVMRKAEGKQYGYVILPIAVPAGKSAEEALADNKNYKVVWQVLQALRAHDERFDALVNKIDLTGNTGGVIEIIDGSPNSGEGDWEGNSKPKEAGQVPLFDFDFTDWKDAILAKIVQKVGERTYWENWAKDVAEIAKNHIGRITHLVEGADPTLTLEFQRFLKGIQDNLNPSISKRDAIEMIAQHLITKPVFDALFEEYAFTDLNPVSISMNRMVAALEKSAMNMERESLEGFYESVRLRASGISDAGAKQKIIKELYEKFFRIAFSGTSDRLGIVYTPNEIVDFVIQSAEDILTREFGKSIGDQGVHVLDPFTGTGTFIVRLLQSGIIQPNNLQYKFQNELHANELVLLAYYVAAVNIEETYHSLAGGKYLPFEGIVLTDTFQIAEGKDSLDVQGLFPENNSRVIAQNSKKIQVILGNPPYSIGQESVDDENPNFKYEDLDSSILNTYAARSRAGAKNSLYDSYIRAFRWASNRIEDKGVISFVTNGAWIDSRSADGFRDTLAKEFNSIYVLNLRGNARTQGEIRKKEGGGVFGEGSRTPVTISLLVKNPDSKEQGVIHYLDIGDYLTREDKLSRVSEWRSFSHIEMDKIEPDANLDWINKRDTEYGTYIPLVSKDKTEKEVIFEVYSSGVETSRDALAYNFSKQKVAENMRKATDYYNSCLTDPTGSLVERSILSWSRSLKNDLTRGKKAEFVASNIRVSSYRPFTKQWLYFDKMFNEYRYKMTEYFPEGDEGTLVLCLTGQGSNSPFSALVTDSTPNRQFMEKAMILPLTIPKNNQPNHQASLFESDESARSNISDWAVRTFSTKFGRELSRTEVFEYVYAILNSKDYIERYSSDLRKDVPRIPLVREFEEMIRIGKELIRLHLDYESLPEFGSSSPIEPSKIEKIRFGSNKDKSKITISPKDVIDNVPLDAYEYLVNGKPAVEWIMDRYQVRMDKDTGIVNDPNDWESPSYVASLLRKIITLSLETEKLRGQMPKFSTIRA
jgi:predicted helicase